MLPIALSCLFSPVSSCMFVKLFTPLPPVHVHALRHATVLPLADVSCAHDWPDDAEPAPHWSSRSEYVLPAATTSHCPQCCEVSICRLVGAAAARGRRARRDARRIVPIVRCTLERMWVAAGVVRGFIHARRGLEKPGGMSTQEARRVSTQHTVRSSGLAS